MYTNLPVKTNLLVIHIILFGTSVLTIDLQINNNVRSII